MAQIGQILLEFATWQREREGGGTPEHPIDEVNQFLVDIEHKEWMPSKGPDLTHEGIVNALKDQWIGGSNVDEGAMYIGPVWAALIADVLVDPNGHATPEAQAEGEGDQHIDIPGVVDFLEAVALGRRYSDLESSHVGLGLRVQAANALMRWFDTVTYDRTLRELDTPPPVEIREALPPTGAR